LPVQAASFQLDAPEETVEHQARGRRRYAALDLGEATLKRGQWVRALGDADDQPFLDRARHAQAVVGVMGADGARQ
jgi:hypothetical protein